MWMMNSKFDEHIRNKTDEGMVNELLCKVLCHNICVVIQSMYELGIEPTFGAKSATLTREPTFCAKPLRCSGSFGRCFGETAPNEGPFVAFVVRCVRSFGELFGVRLYHRQFRSGAVRYRCSVLLVFGVCFHLLL
jgi:hypothetical protein